MRSLRIRAYAKINLGLRVLGKRPDGLHEIDTLLQSIDLADELVLVPRSDGKVTLMTEPDFGISTEENLASRAAHLLRERVGCKPGVNIHLSKKIPVGAGLGGGSSDAAAVLGGLNQLFNLRLSKDELKTLGAELGSDVPFFFEGGRCRATGRGELLQELLPDGMLKFVVLLVPPFSLRTREVYEAFDHLTPCALNSPFHNDLEVAALELRPELGEYRAFLERVSVPFGLSGSGPTYYALVEADDEQIVQQAQAILRCKVYSCRPVFLGHEIVGSFKAS